MARAMSTSVRGAAAESPYLIDLQRGAGTPSLSAGYATMATRSRSPVSAAFILGIGLSGFIDGILLHQVLQWHHLLSLVPGETFRDIGTQILADGLFHVLMYAITAVGLLMLWRRRAALDEPGAASRVGGGFLLGFGVWNIIDVGFFHWILGIHRIRVDVPDPMTYDIAWLVLLGLIPTALGWRVLRRRGGGGGGRQAATALAFLALLAAPIASLPVPGSRTALILLRPGASPAPAINAALAAGAPILWMDSDRGLIAVGLSEAGAAPFYRSGALLVTRSPALAGCLAAVRA
jgi:uncharacterized membrane protein